MINERREAQNEMEVVMLEQLAPQYHLLRKIDKYIDFSLKREYALQMPTSYVDIDRDEMEYIDGGGTYSGAKGWAAASAMVAIGGGAAYCLGSMVAMLVPFGVVGWLVAAFAFSAPAYIATTLANAGKQVLWYMYKKGSFTI